jgi:tRNA-specific 2-thiouridylase
LLLCRAGCEVRAATLVLWDSCHGTDAMAGGKGSAEALGTPFYSQDQQIAFRRLVVEPYIAGYLAGETPNPCVECNRFRLAKLLTLARSTGAASIATGHYARVVWRHGWPFVARAADRRKDQSYMLWRVSRETLARLDFPLGEMTKGEVRGLAAAAGLAVAAHSESQEACFAPAGPRQFLCTQGVEPRAGDVVSGDGTVVGRHQGQWNFTVGQRRGLRVAAGEPLYVLERCGRQNQVVAGPREALAREVFGVRELVDWGLGDGTGLTVQLRYRSRAVAVARLEHRGAGQACVRLAKPFEAVAVGQSAVFYDGDVVVGGGVISAQESL